MTGEMSLNLKQGSSLLDDDEENSSSMKGLQQQSSSTTILGNLAEEEEVSDHDTEEDSDECYEEENDGDNSNDDEEGDNEEEISVRTVIEKEKENDEGLVSNNSVNVNTQPTENHSIKELPDTLSSSAIDSDPKMSLLSNFFNRGISTKTPTQEKTEKVTGSSSGESVSDETPLFPTVSDARAISAASCSFPPAPQPVSEQSALLQISPPTEKLTSERNEEGAEIARQEESHSAFSEEDYEFFSTYLNERDKKKDFEHASRESFTVCEHDADGELHDEDSGTEDIFKPTIPIEEQFLIQEERAARTEAIKSTASLARTSNNINSKNVALRSLPLPSFAAALANARKEEEGHHKKPLPTTRISPQPLSPQKSPALALPLLPDNVLSASFPPEKYSFASRKGLEEVDYEEEEKDRGVEDSIACNPSYTPELPLSPPQVSPGLIAEAGAAASKIVSQVESNTDKFKKTAFAIEVKMMKEETKGLHCYELVCALFGEDNDNLKMPSPDMIKKLKNAIDIELTIKRFRDYKEVVDINTAEIFMKDKNALEDICRQQVMSNPLFSSLDYENSIPNNNNKSKILTSKSLPENASDSAPIDSEKNTVIATTAAPAMVTPQVALYQELTNILNDSSENTDPATRLTNKISFLKNILGFKIGSMCNISKILNLISFIIKQALITIGGATAAERVLLYNGSSDNSLYSSSMGEEPSLSGAGIGLLFGTLLGGVNSVIIRSCVSVARLAMTMGVPIVMLNWPKEFKVSKDYDNILRESILKFKHTFNVSPSFILDSIFGAKAEEEEKETTNNTPTTAMTILTGKEKAKIIRDTINNYNDRHLFGLLFEGYYEHNSNKKQRVGTLEVPMGLLYQNASNIIEHKNRITDNMLSGIVEYLEDNKMLVSKILHRLITQAGLAATMYYINSSSVKKASNINKNNNVETNSERHYKGSSALLKKSEEKGISSVRTILGSRRGVMGGSLSTKRGKLRSMMPVIAAPQKIISTKPS